MIGVWRVRLRKNPENWVWKQTSIMQYAVHLTAPQKGC